MFTSSPIKAYAVPRALTLLFALWFCGACCLVCGAKAAASVETDDAAAGSCAEHSCCRGKVAAAAATGAKQVKALPVSHGAAGCCARARQAAVLTYKQAVPDAGSAATPAIFTLSLRFGSDGSTILKHPNYFPDCRKTYLRCCVFLI